MRASLNQILPMWLEQLPLNLKMSVSVNALIFFGFRSFIYIIDFILKVSLFLQTRVLHAT